MRYLPNILERLLPAVVLAALLIAVSGTCAFADEVSDAQYALDQAEARLADIQDEYDKLQAEAEQLRAQIDAAIKEVMAAQEEVRQGRITLGSYVASEYKYGEFSLFTVIFESESIADLINNINYYDSIQKSQAAEVEAQVARVDALNAAIADLDEKKDAQMKAIKAAEDKKAEAAAVVENARDALEKAEAEAAAREAARLAELERQAALLAAQQAAADSGGGDEVDTTQTGDATGWMTGVASAYGNYDDGALGSPTATGAIVTEGSMGVAVPMAWPNYRSYFGRTVEISYGGMAVLAVVNDCGGMNGGARSLDLQPGVWRAFGFSSCADWGLRTVSYRFL